MIVLPNHYGTLPAAAQTAAASQDALPSQVPPPPASQSQEHAEMARAPAGSVHQRRTHQQPAAVGSRRSTRARRAPKRHNAHSMHAPYIKLTPIEDDENMEVDGGEEMVVARRPVQELSKEATLVSPKPRCTSIIQDSRGTQCCIYCHDIGSYIWRCIQPTCGITVCVRKEEGDHGCVDATPDVHTGRVLVTEETFKCPQCYRGKSRPLPVSTLTL
jgi:hypothetical protein